MSAPLRARCAAAAWTMLLLMLAIHAPIQAKTSVVTLSQLVAESDTIVYGSFKSSPKPFSQSNAFMEFAPTVVLRGKHVVAHKLITFCNASGESSPDLSRIKGTVVIFAKNHLECFQPAHGGKSLIRVKAGRARTAMMDDQPETQPLAALLKKISALIAK